MPRIIFMIEVFTKNTYVLKKLCINNFLYVCQNFLYYGVYTSMTLLVLPMLMVGLVNVNPRDLWIVNAQAILRGICLLLL